MIKVAIFCLVAILLLGCAKLTTTYSTFQIDARDLEKVEAIVHSSFIELGFDGGTIEVNKSEQNVYRIIGRPYLFIVTYKITNEQITIQIRNTKMKASDSDLMLINEYLSKATELISKKLQNANLKARVETKSHWVPGLL